MSNCARCSRPLPPGKSKGNCEKCQFICPCGRPRSGPQGYCPACQRQRRSEQAEGRAAPRAQRRRAAPDGLRSDQKWFANGTAEERLTVQRITLDIERSAQATRLFYRPDELAEYIDALVRS